MSHKSLQAAPLGKKSTYISTYQSDLLFAIPRALKRSEIGIAAHETLPFQGNDIWNGFELSWLNNKGKPIVAIAEFVFPCESLNLIESKSFKLYLNSFNNSKFNSLDHVQALLAQDLSDAAGTQVAVNLMPLRTVAPGLSSQLDGMLLDELDIDCNTYVTEPTLLQTEESIVTETLCSDLLKSNCLVTGQPDWGSVQIHYTGKKIQHAGLLQYIVSFRNHNEFHEQCVERIFMDIMKHCHPEKLCVYARYTRRGGLDINPYRANYAVKIDNLRLVRQ